MIGIVPTSYIKIVPIGICRGKDNFMGNGYMGLPIAITVEGANILTRSMITFGQGM